MSFFRGSMWHARLLGSLHQNVVASLAKWESFPVFVRQTFSLHRAFTSNFIFRLLCRSTRANCESLLTFYQCVLIWISRRKSSAKPKAKRHVFSPDHYWFSVRLRRQCCQLAHTIELSTPFWISCFKSSSEEAGALQELKMARNIVEAYSYFFKWTVFRWRCLPVFTYFESFIALFANLLYIAYTYFFKN